MKLLPLVIAALLLAAQGATAAPQTISVEGIFVDEVTGRGILGASVELCQRYWGFPGATLGDRLAVTTTDAKGKFRFVGPWRGKMRIICYDPRGERHGGVDVKGEAHDFRIVSYRRVVITGG